MTSSTDTTGHPDIAEISDLTEDLLPDARSADVRRHLDTCASCAEVYASLEEVRTLLGALPAPATMPADLAERLDAALAAEAPLRVTGTSDSPQEPSSAGASVPPPATDEDAPASKEAEPAHVSRETPPSADRPAGHPAAATGPGRREGRRRRSRRRSVVLGTVLTVAVLGAGSLFVRSLVGDQPDSARDTRTTAAGSFSERPLQSQVADLLSAQKQSQPGTGSKKPDLGIESQSNTPGSTEGPETLIQPSASVPDCVRKGIGGNGDVLGVKKGTYDGRNAYLVVLPDRADGSRVTAYVVDAACVDQRSAAAGKVLLKQSLPRP